MKKIVFCSIFSIFSIIFLLSAQGCSKEKNNNKSDNSGAVKIAVFIPGVAAGSPTYEMLISGVKQAVSEDNNASFIVMEAGFNQGEWENKMTALAATANYNFIITSNPAMPEICGRISKIYPKQKFIILDSYLEGNSNIYTFLYNKMEQAYLIGAMGALVTESNMPDANKDLKIGFIAGQEYPLMNNIIKPGFEKGIKSINKNILIDFRIVGNWYDASKGAELASQMYNSGVDVILPIAGGAGQGVLSAAKEKKGYVLWFDDNGYALSEGQVVGCCASRQDKAAYEITKKALAGTAAFGKADIGGIKEGYIYFIDDDPIYKKLVPEDIRNKMKEIVDMVASGKIKLDMPLN